MPKPLFTALNLALYEIKNGEIFYENYNDSFDVNFIKELTPYLKYLGNCKFIMHRVDELHEKNLRITIGKYLE